jgi:hypothetical protein
VENAVEIAVEIQSSLDQLYIAAINISSNLRFLKNPTTGQGCRILGHFSFQALADQKHEHSENLQSPVSIPTLFSGEISIQRPLP